MKSLMTQQIAIRVKQVVETYFKWGDKRQFCIKYNIDYGNFNRSLKNYKGYAIDPAWIAAIVLEFGVSADWILTGRGEMK